jgi:hypothetical protein
MISLSRIDMDEDEMKEDKRPAQDRRGGEGLLAASSSKLTNFGTVIVAQTKMRRRRR